MNNLSELWSLIDFVQPGLLGKHVVFNEQLAIPIAQKGFQNFKLVIEFRNEIPKFE